MENDRPAAKGERPPSPAGTEAPPGLSGVRRQRIRLSITNKLLFGYGILAGLVMVVSLVSIVGLSKLNRINESIMMVDVPAAETADRMIDAVLDQENYARRSKILDSRELMDLSLERRRDFRELLERMANLPRRDGTADMESLLVMHERYSEAIVLAVGGSGDDASRVGLEGGPEARDIQSDLIAVLKAISAEADENQRAKTALTARLGAGVFRIIVVTCVAAALLSIVSAFLLARSIALPLSKLKEATERISEGKYDEVPNIRSMDEVGDLSSAFSAMAGRLKRLEEMYIDAQPLTRLPGSIAIENVLGKRLATGEPIAFCYVDIDNFKAFNDRYGYARGSEVIKRTAAIVEEVVHTRGEAEDFVGHVGGDDFIVLTVPDRFRTFCTGIISAFDAAIPDFYNADDRKAGSIVSKTRQGQVQRFPLITVSIAVVTNRERSFENPIQVGEMAADLKEYAKSLEGSVYVVDRRRESVQNDSDNAVSFPATS